MTVRTSILWKMNMHMAKKWPEKVVQRSFIKRHSFRNSLYYAFPFCMGYLIIYIFDWNKWFLHMEKTAGNKHKVEYIMVLQWHYLKYKSLPCKSIAIRLSCLKRWDGNTVFPHMPCLLTPWWGGKTKGWFDEFDTRLNIIIGIFSKSIRVTKVSFCQNDVLIGGLFWQKDSLVTLLLFELWLLWYLAQCQIHRITL